MAAHSFALASFWRLYYELPVETQRLADKQFRLFSENPRHPSLGFARKGDVWTAEVGRGHRAIARLRDGNFYWFWIALSEPSALADGPVFS